MNTTDQPRAVASTSFVLRRWLAKKVIRYDDGTRVLEYESEPPGITKFVTRSIGEPRQISYLVGKFLRNDLESAIALVSQNTQLAD